MTPEILSLEARQALQRGDLAAAAKSLIQMTELTPRDHGVWGTLASVLVRAGQAEHGLAAARRAVSLDRRNGEYHNILGVALGECGVYEEALQSFRKALKLKPLLGGAYLNLGKTLSKLDRLDEAIEVYRRGRRVDPGNNDIRSNLALALWGRGAVADAVREYEELAAALPNDPIVARDLAEAISSASGAEEACRYYAEALRKFPQSPDLHWAYARELLALERWEEGWREYLWRPLRAAQRWPQAGAPFEPLTARDVSRRTVLLEPEQGLGDVLFFCRFVDELRQFGAQVRLRCPPQLAPLIDGIDQAEGPVAADLTLGLEDLPAVLRTRKVSAPLAVKADAARVEHWRRQLADWGPRPYIGITWRGGTDMTRIPEFGRNWGLLSKRIDVKVLGEAVRVMPGSLICVQRQPQETEMAAFSGAAKRVVHDATAVNEDLSEMAALLAALDEYVCVSNTNTHIAAGIGLAARVLVPHPAEWRWLAAGDASPWFPGTRIYRQDADRSWTAAMQGLARDMRVNKQL